MPDERTTNKSRHCIVFGESLDIDNQNHIGEQIESLTAYDVLLVQVERNLSFKERVINLTRSPCYTVQSCKQDLNTFLCLYRAKEDNGCDVNEASI